MKTEDRTSSF